MKSAPDFTLWCASFSFDRVNIFSFFLFEIENKNKDFQWRFWSIKNSKLFLRPIFYSSNYFRRSAFSFCNWWAKVFWDCGQRWWVWVWVKADAMGAWTEWVCWHRGCIETGRRVCSMLLRKRCWAGVYSWKNCQVI